MTKLAIRLATLAAFVMALIAAPAVGPAFAAGGGGGGADPGSSSAPASSNSKATSKNKKTQKQSSIDEQKFLQGYRAAHATIYDRNDYAAAIDQLKALGQDDRANVANLIGYSYRKLGDYKFSQIWYQRA